jgi:hypothetical protein
MLCIHEILSYISLMTPKDRREILLQEMSDLESQGKDCRGCLGNCCTFEANSMMVTPVEAFELMTYLCDHHKLTDDLKTSLNDTITKFRLDHPSGNGRKSFIRRTYTCPFFNHGELGCPLPRDVKPYGCLAFNAHHAEKKADENCFSNLEALKSQDEMLKDDVGVNLELRTKYSLFWEKTPLPLALKDLWPHFAHSK